MLNPRLLLLFNNSVLRSSRHPLRAALNVHTLRQSMTFAQQEYRQFSSKPDDKDSKLDDKDSKGDEESVEPK